MAVVYSPGIIITDQKRDGSNIAPITGNKGKRDFIDTTRAALDRIKGLATGARLLAAIDASGRTVKIYRVWEPDGGNSQGGSTDDEMVKDMDDTLPDGTSVLTHIMDTASMDLSNRGAVKKFLGIGKVKPRFLKRDALARLIGTTPLELSQMEKGRVAIPDSVNFKIRSYLYAFLVPGDGCSCYVKFNHKRDNLSDGHKKYLPMSHTWEHRPPFIALGHELIHAWRAMTGMVLFDYGWEEEAMTVGLPPFTFMDFTENKLRVETGGLAVRPDYQNIQTKTSLTDGQKLGVDRSNMAWQGNQGALHADHGAALAMASRRRAMGYDNDNDDDDNWD